MAGQVDPDDAVLFGELLGLLPPELAGGRKAVNENQWKPLTGDAYECVAYRYVSRRHNNFCCGHSCAPSMYLREEVVALGPGDNAPGCAHSTGAMEVLLVVIV